MTQTIESELRILFGSLPKTGYARISVSLNLAGDTWLASSAQGEHAKGLLFHTAEDPDPIEALRKLFYAPTEKIVLTGKNRKSTSAPVAADDDDYMDLI